MKNLFTQPQRVLFLSLTAICSLFAGLVNAQVTDSNPIESLRCNLFLVNDNNSTAMMDGNMTNFHDIFSNAVGNDDALKLSNSGENFGLLRDGRRLAVEQRKKITGADTCFLVMWNMQRRKYRMVITADKMVQPTRRAFLEDSYNRTSTPILLQGNTEYDFLVTTDPGSFAQNRFRIVFSQGRKPKPPVSIHDVLLSRNGNNILVQWKVDNEDDMNNYEVELSDNGGQFMPVRSVTPYNTSDGLGYSINQPVSHKGEYSFRIRGNANSGQVIYSKTASIQLELEKSDILVYPNPVVKKTVNLQFIGQPAGKYSAFLISSNGNRMPLQTIQHQMGNSIHTVTLPSTLQGGIYRLQLIGSDNSNFVKTINVL